MKQNVFKRAKITYIGMMTLALAGPAMAGVYKCVDKQNRTYYQDKPCQDMSAAHLPNSLTKLTGTEEARSFFWKATGQKRTVYLLGSLHFGGQSLFPLPQVVNDAFNHSDVMVVEANIKNLSGKELAGRLAARGHYPNDGRLEDHIKRVTWDKTLDLANKLQLGEETLVSDKPWLAALVLTSQSLKQEGFSVESGIEKSFIEQAQGKKPVLELENVDDQIALFDQLSDQEQEQLLLHALQESNRGTDYHKGIINAWKQGDSEAMDLLVRQNFDSGQISSKLFNMFFVEPNERMTNRIMDLSNDGRIYFVVVGSGHLGGEKGILSLLEKKGLAVTQP